MKYYSQFKQDQFVYENFLKDRQNGFFVDIGAYDGEIDSNSLFFENLGWNGICIEPNPEAFKKLQNIRKCTCLPYAVSDINDNLQFFQIKDRGLSTLSGLVNEFTQRAIERINTSINIDDQNFNYINVECKTFDSIIEVYNIDFLSLDTEGNELKILRSIDFNKYNIDIITVENNDYDDKFFNFLTTKNYKFITRLGCDELYKKIK
jgi:FkbM family methyltransferase